ncbi:MAG: hypothetical protein D6753_11090 [Planctomycetota bacterium]|nr:MAG: hypothetical protein D6753_11090 [Planctomycetota bacterium]
MPIDLLAPRRTLVWSAYDPSGVLPAALHQFLEPALPDQVEAVFAPLDHLSSQIPPTVGLVACHIGDNKEIEPAVRMLAGLTSRPRPPVRICWTAEQTCGCWGLLVEAGAQVVVGQLPSLQVPLRRIVAHAPLEYRAGHPLLDGVRELLPW